MSNKSKSQLSIKKIGFGCNAHIIPNCAKTASDSMPVDIEVLLRKSLGIFTYTRLVQNS
jgi:hypothetical protein